MRFDTGTGRWVAQIAYFGIALYLGEFDSEQEAVHVCEQASAQLPAGDVELSR